MTFRHFTIRVAITLLSCATLATVASAQFPPAPKPLEPKVPQGVGGCVINKPCAQVAPDIIKKVLGPSELESNLRQLTDFVGGRVTGSPAADKAIDWAVQAFRAAGVDEVLTENFTLPVGWVEGHTRLEVLAPEPFSVHLVSTGWSPATPSGGLTANVIDVGTGDEAGFKHAGQSAKGAIVLVHTNVLKTWDDLMGEYYNEPAIVDRAVAAGAGAIFWMSTRPYTLLYRHNLSLTGELERLPQAVVAREDAMRLARFISAGQPVRVHLDMPNKITQRAASENVVAEIRGSEKPDEFVILGAHLDSWELGTGALDDGCNAALVIDAARAIRATGSIPKRSIRFVLFTGEEQGMLGSWAYALAHRTELDHMDAAIIFDSGDGKVTGYSLGGRKDIAANVTQALQPLASLGPFENTFDADIGTDNFDFLLEGVPTLVANQQPDDYMMNYHAASDTFDKVDFAQLKRNEAIAAVTAYAVADLPERLGPRETRKQIERLMKSSGLEKEMKETGFWPMWMDGKRGRQP
ncbi:MAG TPA: M20/M25/M40 family metallo-hydrolase [Candidatus Acidoferrales bacterium]|nr:M20/M25/M40 family metallo-hydrolase [Candidatus Acidoferrales bacterium]